MPTVSRTTMHYLFLLLLLGAAAPASAGGYNMLFLGLTVLVTIYLTVLCDRQNIFQMSFLCGHYAFFAYPVLLYGSFGIPISGYAVVLCLLGTIVALMMSQITPIYERSYDRLRVSLRAYIMLFGVYLAMLFVTKGFSYPYTIPYLVIAFHLITLRTPRYLIVGTAYVVGIAAVGLYFILFSSGFGRLALAAPIFITTLMLLNWLRFPYGKGVLLGAVIVFAFLGSLVRSDIAWNIHFLADVALKDSIATPITILDTIYHHSLGGYEIRLSGWFDQVLLFFLAAVPRALWEGKPNGFGFAYTLENLSPDLVAAGYSMAAIFPGENVYYLGPIVGIAGTLVAVAMVCLLWRLLCRYLNGYLAVGVAVHLPTFYWGGLQAYAGRNLVWLIPALALALLFRFLERPRGLFRRPHPRQRVRHTSP